MSTENEGGGQSGEVFEEKPIDEQVRDQTGQKQVKVRIDESNLRTNYASGFRTSATAEEVILDFGVNIVRPSSGSDQEREITFQANNRLIMNYYSAKRLALTLGMVVRRYEEQFGELKLNAADRRVNKEE